MLEDSAILIKSNSLATQFGVTFNSDAVINPKDYFSWKPYWPIIRKLEPHAITAGVSSFVYYGGCSLNVLSPAAVVATGGADAYSDGGIYGDDPPVLAAAEAESGRAVFIGDMSALRSSKYDGLSDEHKQLLANIVDWLNQGGENEPQDVTVTIDIKPGSNTNSINLESQGVTPVAVLTAGDFKAGDVKPDTVVFAGASPPVRSTMEDVDGDGDDDMLFHFKTQDLKNLEEGSTEATLTGGTLEGTIVGTDSVNIVPKGKKDNKGKKD